MRERRAETAQPTAFVTEDARTGPRTGHGYVLALVWVFVCCALYAVEVLKLLSGLG